MNNPIRVLHVFGKLHSGGAESRTMDIYRSIDRSKVQFDFAIHTTEQSFFTEEVKSLGGRIYSFPRFNGKNYFAYRRAWESFFREKSEYEIIHGHQTSTSFVYLKAAKMNQVSKRIAHARNSKKDSKMKKYLAKLSRYYATDLFGVSRLAAISEFGERLVEEGKVKIIPNAINVSRYTFNVHTRQNMRAELGLDNELAIVHIGRFHPQKNHEFLLEVFKEVLNQNENARLFIIGDGFLRSEIENRIAELGISENVDLLGVRSDVPDLLQAMDVLLFPSLFEGLPGVVLEAQASGLPSVISNEITKEVNLTDLVEYIPLDKSPEYWSNRILNITEHSNRRNTYDQIVNKGYDIESVSKWYEDFYLSDRK